MAERGRPRRFDKQAALRIAMELFWEHGYEGTSLSMLTSQMGITSTSLYAAFGSKDELFRQAVELYNSADAAPTDGALRLPTARAAIEAVLRENAEAYIDPETPRGCMVVLSGVNLAGGHEHVGSYLRECRRRDYAKILERIERGAGEGDVPAAADAPALASFVLTVLQGLSIQARDGCTPEQAHAVIDGAMLGWDAMVQRAGEVPAGSGEAPAGGRP